MADRASATVNSVSKLLKENDFAKVMALVAVAALIYLLLIQTEKMVSAQLEMVRALDRLTARVEELERRGCQ